MRVLFVAPNSSGSGEAIAAAQMARLLGQRGHEIRFFADAFAARFVVSAGLAGAVESFPADVAETAARWLALLQSFQPHLIVFADYPLLWLSAHGRALLEKDSWAALDDLNADLVTLDHLGLAQGPLTIAFGPPHLDLFLQHFPAIPDRMKILLPCPIHDPTSGGTMRGQPYQYWQVPFSVTTARRQAVRDRFLGSRDELLVFHSTSTWALSFCRRHSLPNASFMTRVFESLLRDVQRPVVIVSVNGGLLPAGSPSHLRLVNVGELTPEDYDALLLSSDLMVTDNRISSSLGKAICGLVPCVALRNSRRLPEIVERGGEAAAIAIDMDRERAGSVFPFEVFPIWSLADVEELGVFAGNPIEDCMVMAEMYGGNDTRRLFRELMLDDACRQGLQSAQAAYAAAIRRLPTADQLLQA